MNAKDLKAAVSKYQSAYYKDPETAFSQMIDDLLSEEDIKQVTTAIPVKKLSVAEQQANHPTLKWYDEFHVRVHKKSVQNVYANKQETIITGWEFVKKLMPKFIEPAVALQLNQFANGYNSDQVGLMLVLKDTVKTGDMLAYKTWADQYGIDPAKDLNQLLANN